MKKVVLLGWDGVSPRIIFDELIGVMPNLERLLNQCNYSCLRSTKPQITIPAWMSVMTGCDLGQLGLYGFRHHKPGNYDQVWIPSSSDIRFPRIWDMIGERGGRGAVIGVPPTYPPRVVNGILVSGFFTPDTKQVYMYPNHMLRQ